MDGNGTTLVSTITTLFRGAFGSEACVPLSSQLSPEAGQSYFSPESPMQSLLQAAPQASLEACLASCATDRCCFAQFAVSSGTCQTIALAPAFPASVGSSGSGLQLMYKLPANSLGAASSLKGGASSSQGAKKTVKAKMLQSGYYATCGVPASNASVWQAGAGSSLGPDARTFSASPVPVWDANTTPKACKARCDESNVCFGFFWNATNASCLYRGGVDALATRAFFVIPTAVDLESLSWAAAPVAVPACGGATSGSTNSNTSGSTNSSTNGGTTNGTTNGTTTGPSPSPSPGPSGSTSGGSLTLLGGSVPELLSSY